MHLHEIVELLNDKYFNLKTGMLQLCGKFWNLLPKTCPSTSKQAASSSLLLAFASMVILGVEPHWDL
jgi:hypothetical protein